MINTRKVCFNTRGRLRFLRSCALLTSTLTFAFCEVSADVVATDGDIPLTMDAGSLISPAEYILGENGAYDLQFTNTSHIGSNNPRNSLLVRNGSTLTMIYSTGLGFSASSNNNSLTVTGSGSRLLGTHASITVGNEGSSNSMRVDAGATVTAGSATVGRGPNPLSSSPARGNNNTLTVTGSGSGLTLTSALYVGQYGSGNRMDVGNGAQVSVTSSFLSIGHGQFSYTTLGNANQVAVTDAGSKLTVSGGIFVGENGSNNSFLVSGGAEASALSLGIGLGTSSPALTGYGNEALVTGMNSRLDLSGGLTIGNYGGDNSFTVADSALVTVGGDVFISAQTVASENYLRLDGGFFAWEGDNESLVTQLLAEGRILAWNLLTDSWENALNSDSFYINYFETDDDALAYTGYDGLGGYTLLSTGAAIPEPGTYAMVLSALVAGVAFCLKRRRAA